VIGHGWWLMNEAKMSKSLGNVVQPQGYVDRFGVDALRYFVMREMVVGQDASFTDDVFLTRYNSDLANDLGNVVSRVATMIQRYCDGRRAGAWPDRRHRQGAAAADHGRHRLGKSSGRGM
jgi:methionyl-tRNA synthetase